MILDLVSFLAFFIIYIIINYINQKMQMQMEDQKIDLSKLKVITYKEDPEKMVRLKESIQGIKVINGQIAEHISQQTNKIDEVVASTEATKDNVEKGNKIMVETTKKYGFFKLLKLKLGTLFGIGGAVTGHPIAGALMSAGAYGMGTAAEKRINTQLDKMGK